MVHESGMRVANESGLFEYGLNHCAIISLLLQSDIVAGVWARRIFPYFLYFVNKFTLTV